MHRRRSGTSYSVCRTLGHQVTGRWIVCGSRTYPHGRFWNWGNNQTNEYRCSFCCHQCRGGAAAGGGGKGRHQYAQRKEDPAPKDGDGVGNPPFRPRRAGEAGGEVVKTAKEFRFLFHQCTLDNEAGLIAQTTCNQHTPSPPSARKAKESSSDRRRKRPGAVGSRHKRTPAPPRGPAATLAD